MCTLYVMVYAHVHVQYVLGFCTSCTSAPLVLHVCTCEVSSKSAILFSVGHRDMVYRNPEFVVNQSMLIRKYTL